MSRKSIKGTDPFKLDYYGLKVTGDWTFEPELVDFELSCSSAYDCIDFGSGFDFLFGIGFHISASAKVVFGVKCEDDCPQDKWSYDNRDNPFLLSGSIDSQFAPPVWCGLFGSALKKAGAKNIHVSAAAAACWTALITNVSNALPGYIAQLREIINSQALPIIYTLYELGPDVICMQHRN